MKHCHHEWTPCVNWEVVFVWFQSCHRKHNQQLPPKTYLTLNYPNDKLRALSWWSERSKCGRPWHWWPQHGNGRPIPWPIISCQVEPLTGSKHECGSHTRHECCDTNAVPQPVMSEGNGPSDSFPFHGTIHEKQWDFLRFTDSMAIFSDEFPKNCGLWKNPHGRLSTLQISRKFPRNLSFSYFPLLSGHEVVTPKHLTII